MTLVRGYILFFTLITQHTPVTAFSPLTDEVNNILVLVIMQCSVEQPWNMASITDAYNSQGHTPSTSLDSGTPFWLQSPPAVHRLANAHQPGLQSSQIPVVSSTCSMQWKKYNPLTPQPKSYKEKKLWLVSHLASRSLFWSSHLL